MFKNKHVDERTEIVTRGTVAVGGILTSAIVADAVVDLVVKKSTEEAVKRFHPCTGIKYDKNRKVAWRHSYIVYYGIRIQRTKFRT